MTEYEKICTRNLIAVIRPQIQNARRIVAHHFKHRHDGRGNNCVRNWIGNLRDIDRASGYSNAVKKLANAS